MLEIYRLGIMISHFRASTNYSTNFDWDPRTTHLVVTPNQCEQNWQLQKIMCYKLEFYLKKLEKLLPIYICRVTRSWKYIFCALRIDTHTLFDTNEIQIALYQLRVGPNTSQACGLLKKKKWQCSQVILSACNHSRVTTGLQLNLKKCWWLIYFVTWLHA